MAWFRDLDVCTYLPLKDVSQLRAVGWLTREQRFSTGDVDERVFEKLCELTQNPWAPVASLGRHHCELCRFTGDSEARYRKISGSTVSFRQPGYLVSAAGAGVCLFVPGDGVIYVSPTNITHYIDAHGYCPPAEFCDAALRSPEMRSMAYMKAILANGGRGLVAAQAP